MTSDDMEINLVRTTSEGTLAKVLGFLWGGGKGGEVNPAVYKSDDSILEIPEIYAFCVAPRSVAMQLETHKKKHGIYVWMTSARPDRSPQAAREYSRTQPVRFVMKLTARGLIHMSHARMCMKAEEPTRRFMALLKKVLKESSIQPCWRRVAEMMMPMCAYRNGLCTELRGCGNPQRYEDFAGGGK